MVLCCGDPGVFGLYSWVFPLQHKKLLGTGFPGPEQAGKNLAAMYGPNWRVPRGKGYKFIVCPVMPSSLFGTIVLALFLAALPYISYQFYHRYKDSRSGASLPRYQPLPRE